MADRHPYVSGSGTIVQVINQFRQSFPPNVTALTLQKLGLAPKNESYVLNILRFLQLIDEEGNRTGRAAEIFSKHDDSQFASHFSEVVKEAYSDLFELHGEQAWELDRDTLITFFRSNDHTSSLVGGRQAGTFRALAALAGHGEVPTPKATKKKSASGTSEKKSSGSSRAAAAKKTSVPADTQSSHHTKTGNDLGLTVRIEVNLPADADQETYDNIFKSIRENLLNE